MTDGKIQDKGTFLAKTQAPAQTKDVVNQKQYEEHEAVLAAPEPGLASEPAAGANASFVKVCTWLAMPEQAISSWSNDAPAAPAAFCVSFFLATLIQTVRTAPGLNRACFSMWSCTRCAVHRPHQKLTSA